MVPSVNNNNNNNNNNKKEGQQEQAADSNASTTSIRTPLLPTENFENSLPDGIMTMNIFELPPNQQQGNGANNNYELFVKNLKSRLVEICTVNPWLLGRLEQTRVVSLTSPLNGDYELVSPPTDLSTEDIETRILRDVLVESPNDLPFTTIDGSPLADLARFVQAEQSTNHQLSGRTYQDLSKLLKRPGSSTAIGTGPESAKAQTSLFKLVVTPTPSYSHVFVVVTLSHAIGDGNTYHRLLHMLLESTDRKTNQPVPVRKLVFTVEDLPSAELQETAEAMAKQYKKERDTVVPEAKLLDQIKLGLDIGLSTLKQQIQPQDRALQSFVALVNPEEINRIKKHYTDNKEYQQAVFGDETDPNKKMYLSANDVLVCEISKLFNVDRIDTNMDVRTKVLEEQMKIPHEVAANTGGNFVAMLPFFRPHFDNPWYVRKTMIRGNGDENKFYADPLPIGQKDRSNITGNLSNWSGFTVGTKLGGGTGSTTASGAAKLVLHLPINVTASGNSPFEQALVFCPFQDQPKQLAVVISTHRHQKVLKRMEQSNLLIPFCCCSTQA